MVAYLSDVLPPARRGRMILLCGAIGFLGAPAVVFLIRWLTPLAPLGFEGWRWALVIGAVGCGRGRRVVPLAAGIAALARERAAARRCRGGLSSLRPLSAGLAAARHRFGAPRARRSAEKPTSFWSAAGGRYRVRAVLIAAMYFLSPWATVGFPLLSGAVLVEKGFRVTDSLLYLGVAMFGPTIGVLAGVARDRPDRAADHAGAGGGSDGVDRARLRGEQRSRCSLMILGSHST